MSTACSVRTAFLSTALDSISSGGSGGGTLSLNAREQRILGRVAEELARTAPALASFLHVFNRLASGEEMPARRPLRRLRRRLSTKALTLLFVSVWTFVTAGMLSFALVMTHVGPGSEAGATDSCSAASSVLLPCARVRAPAAP